MKCCAAEKIADPKQKALLTKINRLALAAFLVMIGVLFLLPEGALPESSWVIGLGLILIAGNITRYLYGLGLCPCFTVLGVILVVAGGFGLFGVDFPIFPVLAILAGFGIAVRVVSGKTCCSDKKTSPESSCCAPGEEKTPEI